MATQQPARSSVILKVPKKTGLSRHITPEAQTEIEKCLDYVGLRGKITLVPVRRAKGTPHTKGVRFTQPCNDGVLVTVQMGGNDSRIEAKLCTSRNIDTLTLFGRLKQAHDALEGEDTKVVSLDSRRKEVDSAAANAPAASAVANDSKVSASSSDQPDLATMRKGLFDDLETVQAFMAYACDYADRQFRISTQACMNIIKTGFDLPPSRGNGALISTLTKRGHLIKVSDGLYQIPEQYRPKEDDAPLPTAIPDTGKTTSLLSHDDVLVSRIEALRTQAQGLAPEKAAALKEERATLLKRRKKIKGIFDDLKSEYQQAGQRIGEIDRELEGADQALKAQQQLAEIEVLLGRR